MPLGGGRATPAPPLPGLPSAAAQVFAQLLTQKCFISLPDPHVGKASHVKLRFFAVVWVERRGRVNTVLTQLLQAQVSSLDSGVHSSPPLQDQTHPTLSDLLWPLRHVLFLTPSGNWLSSSKDQVLFLFLPPLPAPCEERVNIYIFYLFAFCVGMGLCPVPGGLMWLLQVGCVPSSPGMGS